jgi:ribosome maturation factor RimP
MFGRTRKGLEPVSNGHHPLEHLIVPAVEGAGYRLVRVRLTGGATKTLQVMAERSDGQMNVEDCAALSRTISEVLEAADPISDEYVLEVSSPGIDRPLTRSEDFARFAGHEARVEVKAPIAGRKRFKGTLLGVEGSQVAMDVQSAQGRERLRLALGDIADAKLILTDKLVQESMKARKSAQ